jgi:hypothetical protein
MGEKGVWSPISETDAYRQHVQEFPDKATLDDYARVRGMGWREDAPATSSSGNGKKPAEPWLPVEWPALLGIGAKVQEVYDDGIGKTGLRLDLMRSGMCRL